MNVRVDFQYRISIFFGIASLILCNPFVALAQVSSSSFQMTSDSVNCGGGKTSSTSFSIVGTLCETATGTNTFPTSTSFNLEQGFPAMDDIPFISASLLDPSIPSQAKNAASFGTVTNSSGVASDSILVRVTTNAANGYSASIISDGELRSGSNTISGVTDGTVDGSPSGEYGFRTSGTDGLYNSSDTNITTSAKTFAQKTTWTTRSDTTLTFKAAVASGNTSGSYAQAVTIVVTGTF